MEKIPNKNNHSQFISLNFTGLQNQKKLQELDCVFYTKYWPQNLNPLNYHQDFF